MLPGTYGVVAGAGFNDAAIRLFTRSRYNHAFVVVDTDGTIVEAESDGAVLAHVSKYDGHLVAFNDTEPLTDAQRSAISLYARSLLGTPYGFVTIAMLAMSLAFGYESRWLTRRVEQEKRLICSQLVARAYSQGAGIDLADGRPDAMVTPGDLADRLTRHCWDPTPRH